MNWSRTIIAGVVGGIVMTLYDSVMHGMIMANAYMKYPEVFRQDAAGVHYFFLVGIMIAIMAAILFSKTRAVWADGLTGGVTFGFFTGMDICADYSQRDFSIPQVNIIYQRRNVRQIIFHGNK